MNRNLGERKLYLLSNKVHVNATGIFGCRGSLNNGLRVYWICSRATLLRGKCTTGRGSTRPDGRRRREKRFETGESEENDLALSPNEATAVAVSRAVRERSG